MILVEMVHDARIIRMNQPHLPPSVRKWMGDSIGHWEGDTLVVETTNFTTKTQFRGSSENLKVTERFTRDRSGNDPVPVHGRGSVDVGSSVDRRVPWPATDEQIYEYACHEGNYALENVLRGARASRRRSRGRHRHLGLRTRGRDMKAVDPNARRCVVLAGYAAPRSRRPRRPAAVAQPSSSATATPESVGISTERLERLHRGMQGYVDRHEAGGIVTLIARDGKVVDVHATGFQDVESRTPMKHRHDLPHRVDDQADHERRGDDARRRRQAAPDRSGVEIHSRVQGPAGRWPKAAATVPARRDITIRDLLTHRSGLSYGFLNGGPVGNAYRKEGVTDGLTTTSMTLEEGINKLAAQPLMAQPGSAWNYSLSADVLGRVVEVGLGHVVRRVPARSHHQAARDDRHRLRRARGQVAAHGDRLLADGAGGIRPMKDPETFGNTIMSPVAILQSAEDATSPAARG